jgi:uncharacterized protein (DUF924 family)
MPPRIEGILSFWFGLSRNDPDVAEQMMSRWFSDDRVLDAEVRAQFRPAYDAAVAGELTSWEQTARGTLALIIVLDQFSRNMFRGTPRAFVEDPIAQRLCLEGIEQALDVQLCPIERGFFYMPLQHAEIEHLQDIGVQQYERLLRESEEPWKPLVRGMLNDACGHRDIIRRFGRFPHRNAVLGRESTPEERDFLADGAENYGQQLAQ